VRALAASQTLPIWGQLPLGKPSEKNMVIGYQKVDTATETDDIFTAIFSFDNLKDNENLKIHTVSFHLTDNNSFTAFYYVFH